jgi:calcium binding protein 39
MSFFFRGGSRQRPTPQEIVRSIKDSLVALDNKTGTKALDDAEKNILTLRHTLSGDGEVEPNQEQVLQVALEICKEGVLPLFVQNLPSLGWEGRKDLVHCWSILLRQKVDESYCCVQYIENHVDLLDFLVVCYKNLEIALNCGNMLRECIKYPTLAKYILESSSFELFFQYVELPNFDIASDALNTFKDLLTKHEDAVSEFLSSHYEQFFGLYTRLLSSTNYVTRRQSVKVRLFRLQFL